MTDKKVLQEKKYIKDLYAKSIKGNKELADLYSKATMFLKELSKKND